MPRVRPAMSAPRKRRGPQCRKRPARRNRPIPGCGAPRRKEGPGQVGRGVGQDPGGVGDHYAARGRRLEVDVVKAHGHVGHDPQSPPRRVEHLGVDPVGQEGEDRRRSPDLFEQLRAFEDALFGVDAEARVRPPEQFQARLRDRLGDEDIRVHGGSLLRPAGGKA